MPSFSPSAQKVAVAPITISPAGLNCQSEVFLGPNATTKVATSGLKAFTSIGSQQLVRHPLVMPSSPGTYKVYVDVYVAGQLFLAYVGVEDVQIASLGFTFGAMSASRATCPSATGWGMAVLSCAISNPHSQPITQNVKIMWARYSYTYGKWVSCDGQFVSVRENCLCTQIITCLLNPFTLTLAPSESFQFYYKGYCNPDPADPEWTPCVPALGLHYDFYFWLEDEAGNKSSEGKIYIP